MRLITSVLAISILTLPALAADNPPRGGGALREACKADIATLCPGLEPGGGRIRECLRANRDKISDGCKAAIAAARQARKDAKSSSASDPAPMRPTTPP
ncbi:MAG: cysteine rich repeat-containing protein [Alphaproteobacteria bacterium]|nr:cysteine rich repeat-containing protein [Alphaproteobacteria bacterium]